MLTVSGRSSSLPRRGAPSVRHTPNSMDLYFLGLAIFTRGHTAADLNSAHTYFDHALEIDPANVDALVLRGILDFGYAISWLTDDFPSRLCSAEAQLVKALRLRPDDRGPTAPLARFAWSPGASIEASRSANGRWRSTETMRTPTFGSAWQNILRAATTKPKLIYLRRWASVRATGTRAFGSRPWVSRSWARDMMRRRSAGSASDRGQPKYLDVAFPARRRFGPSWAHGRGARRVTRRARTQPDLHCRAMPVPDIVSDHPRLSRGTRAHVRRPTPRGDT